VVSVAAIVIFFLLVAKNQFHTPDYVARVLEPTVATSKCIFGMIVKGSIIVTLILFALTGDRTITFRNFELNGINRTFLLMICTLVIVIWDFLIFFFLIREQKSLFTITYMAVSFMGNILQWIVLQFVVPAKPSNFSDGWKVIFVVYNLLYWAIDVLEGPNAFGDDSTAWKIINELSFPFAVEYRFLCAIRFYYYFK